MSQATQPQHKPLFNDEDAHYATYGHVKVGEANFITLRTSSMFTHQNCAMSLAIHGGELVSTLFMTRPEAMALRDLLTQGIDTAWAVDTMRALQRDDEDGGAL